MTDSGNVVPFPRPDTFQPRAELPHPRPTDPAITALEKVKRVERIWMPLFARNLGEMAALLNPGSPKAGAKAMFKKAFAATTHEAMWRKRSRYLRLPGEAAPPFNQSGDYSTKTADFKNLATAYAELAWPNDPNFEARGIRHLVRGTEVGGGGLNEPAVIEAMDEVRSRLSDIEQRANGDREIATAFGHLARHPIIPFKDGELEKQPTESNMGAARKGAGYSIIPCRQATGLAFPAEELLWFEPRILLGWVYVRRSMFDLSLGMTPEEYDEQLEAYLASSPDKTRDDAEIDFAVSVIDDRLEELVIHEYWPGMEYDDDPTQIPSKVSGVIYDRRNVVLALVFQHGRLNLRLSFTAKERVGNGDGQYFFAHWSEETPEIYRIGATIADDLCLLDMSNGHAPPDPWGKPILHSGFDFDQDIVTIAVDDGIHVIGGCRRNYAAFHATVGATSLIDDEVIPLLATGSDPNGSAFRPHVWDDLTRVAPAAHGSIAATILRNLAFAPEAERIDTLLLADARRRIAGLNDFMADQLTAYVSAIGERAAEPDGSSR